MKETLPIEFDVDIEADYTPSQPGSMEDPAWPEELDITSVKIHNVELVDKLTALERKTIVEALFDNRQEAETAEEWEEIRYA